MLLTSEQPSVSSVSGDATAPIDELTIAQRYLAIARKEYDRTITDMATFVHARADSLDAIAVGQRINTMIEYLEEELRTGAEVDRLTRRVSDLHRARILKCD